MQERIFHRALTNIHNYYLWLFPFVTVYLPRDQAASFNPACHCWLLSLCLSWWFMK